jgi:hypothetical protein
VFSPVDSDASYYFAGPEQAVMVNFRVRDLDAMVAQLRAGGADIHGEIETEEGTSRFAWSSIRTATASSSGSPT